MRRVVWISGALALISGVAVVAVWAHGVSHAGRTRSAGRSDIEQEIGCAGNACTADDSDEVARLRAELREKDRLLLSLATAPKERAEPEQDQKAAPTPARELNPAAHAMELLDERLFTAPRDAHVAADMERQIREAATSLQLGEATVSSLYCNSALCKITLASSTGASTNRTMALLAGHLPKAFGAAAVYEPSNGQSALYVGKSRQDIEPEGASGEGHPEPLVMNGAGKPTETAAQP